MQNIAKSWYSFLFRPELTKSTCSPFQIPQQDTPEKKTHNNSNERFIRIYDKILSPELCQKARDWIDNQARDKKLSFDHDWRRCFSVRVPTHLDWGKEVSKCLVDAFKKYREDVPDSNHLLFHCTHMEDINFLKYNKIGNHQFTIHCDAWNAASSLRQVSLVAYLNTVDEGGETSFTRPDHKEWNRTPIEGSVLLFPSSWQYPHQALEPISNDKYVLIAWFTFNPESNRLFYSTKPF